MESKFVNQTKIMKEDFLENIEYEPIVEDLVLIRDLLSNKEIDKLKETISSKEMIPVGLDGILSNYKIGDNIGSYRLSFFNEEIAEILWKRIEDRFENIGDWKPIGISPLFRVIKYLKSGSLVPHYDAPYIYNENKMTKKSLIIYLTDNKEGLTEFIKDDNDYKVHNYEDRHLYQNDTVFQFYPTKGYALSFPHRTLHRVNPLINEEKIIIRTDIIYERTTI